MAEPKNDEDKGHGSRNPARCFCTSDDLLQMKRRANTRGYNLDIVGTTTRWGCWWMQGVSRLAGGEEQLELCLTVPALLAIRPVLYVQYRGSGAFAPISTYVALDCWQCMPFRCTQPISRRAESLQGITLITRRLHIPQMEARLHGECSMPTNSLSRQNKPTCSPT